MNGPGAREGGAKISVGDVLWYGGCQYRASRTVTAASVGRSWITTEIGRFNVTTMRAEGHNGGRLYASQAEQMAEHELFVAWSALSRRIHNAYGPPSGVTLDIIRQVEALLWPDIPAPRPGREGAP